MRLNYGHNELSFVDADLHEFNANEDVNIDIKIGVVMQNRLSAV